MVEVTLPKWLYQALHKKKFLKISPDYFRIRKAIDRRLYEIARKYDGNQGEFTIALEKLHLKTGSTANKAKFKRMLKNLAKANDLPDYSIRYDAKADMMIFNNRNLMPDQAEKEQQQKKGNRKIYKLKNSLVSKRAEK